MMTAYVVNQFDSFIAKLTGIGKASVFTIDPSVLTDNMSKPPVLCVNIACVFAIGRYPSGTVPMIEEAGVFAVAAVV
jgi:hypothetical protein